MNNKSLTELTFEIRNRFTQHRYWFRYLSDRSLFSDGSTSLDEIHKAKTQSVLQFIGVMKRDVQLPLLFVLTKIVFSKHLKLKDQEQFLESILAFESIVVSKEEEEIEK